MANIRKRIGRKGEISWQAQVRLSGTKQQTKTFPSQAVALDSHPVAEASA